MPAVRASRAQRRQSTPAGATLSRGHVSATLVDVHVDARHERSRAAPQAAGGKPGLMGSGAAAVALSRPTRTSRGAPAARGLPGACGTEAAGAAGALQPPDGCQGCWRGRASRIPQRKARETRLTLCVEDRRGQPRELMPLRLIRMARLNLSSQGGNHAHHQGREASAPPTETTTTNGRSAPDPPRRRSRTPGREGAGASSQHARGARPARTHARGGTAVGAAPEVPRQRKDPRLLAHPGVRGRQQGPGDGRSVRSRSQGSSHTPGRGAAGKPSATAPTQCKTGWSPGRPI